MAAQLSILYFAWVREAIGRNGEWIDRPDAATTVAQLAQMLAERGGGYGALSDVGRIRAALDQRFVPIDTAIGDARELALFPPVTGG